MPPRAPCISCGSTEFEEENGLWFCLNGHDQAEGPQVEEDDGDYASRGKITRKKQDKAKVKTSRIYRGVKAYRLFLQAWQFVLWKQCYTLVHEKEVPRELWTVVRDLWEIRLSHLTHRTEDVSVDQAPETRGMPSVIDTTDTEGEDRENMPKSKINVKASDSPVLWDTIALNVIGLLLLRYPVHLAAIYRYVREEQVCFVRAIRQVPSEMREKLPSEYQLALDTTIIPREEDLQKAVHRNARMYSTSFGMAIPAINWNIILLEYIQELALPLQIYLAVKKLAEMTRFEFNYDQIQDSRRNAWTYPEAQLISLVIVAVKLLFPFDSERVRRRPKTPNELATTRIDWNKWEELQSKHERESSPPDPSIKPGKEIETTDLDVLEMSDAQLDQYMDWFQREYAEPEVGSASYQEILRMFPLKTLPDKQPDLGGETRMEERKIERLGESMATLLSNQPITQEEEEEGLDVRILRPGQRYKQYRKMDDLTGGALAFYREAAQRACLTVDTVLRAVLHVERILVLWQRAKTRAEVFGEELDLDVEMNR